MSEILSDWIRALAGAGVICTLALLLCPEGRPKRVARLAVGCVMAIALLSPVVKPDAGSFAKAFARYSEAAREAADIAGSYERTVIERECEAYIMDRANALGVACVSANAVFRWSEEGFWYPWECSLGCEYSPALANLIESELGIPAERQHWEDT